MEIREARDEDEPAWNAFIKAEGGNFLHDFNWKRFLEARSGQFIPLLVETAPGKLVSILPIAKEKKIFYSVLNSYGGGLLLKKDLTDAEKREITTKLIRYVDANYSSGCSRIELNENLPPDSQLSEEPTPVLIENGFRFRYDKETRLPCQFIIKLKQPFEEHIWKGLWSSKLRNELNKVKRNGVVIIQDHELKYIEEYIDMSHENYKRHETVPPKREEIKIELDTFRDRAKLFVALLDDKPIVTLLCYYYGSTCRLAKIGSYTKETDDVDKLCYATAIEDACNMGYKYADLTVATTPGLASFKERFKGTRIPSRIYDKRYSFPRYVIEMIPVAFKRIRHDRAYFWKNRQKLWSRITQG